MNAGNQITIARALQGKTVRSLRSTQEIGASETWETGTVCGSWRDGEQVGVKVRFDSDGSIQDVPQQFCEVWK